MTTEDIQDIQDIQAKRGWTDRTLLTLLIDFIEARGDRFEACMAHLESIADIEHETACEAPIGPQEQFKMDMEEAGFEVRDYSGRYGYEGYAVTVERHEMQEVYAATKVPLREDSMGLQVVIYPTSMS